jgi:hypothetical protein
MEIPFARPCLAGHEGDAVAEVIASGWVSQGPRVRAFEEAFAARVGAPDAVATTSCTTALALALYVSGVGPGDEVIVPSLSFIATANSVWQCGAHPVFADIDARTYNLDPDAAERAITSRTKVIMPVHQVGLPAEILQHAQLVLHFRASRDEDEGPLHLTQELAELRQLAFEQKAGVRGKQLRDADRRGVSTMHGSECVLDEEVVVVGELLREPGLVLRLTRVEACVLEHVKTVV